MGGQSDLVLVVDDDPAVRNALQFSLELEGLKVRLYDGPQALLADRDRLHCRCLIIDYRMPRMDGLELIEALRSFGIDRPIILIAGQSSRNLQKRAARAGIHRLLEKPLSDGALLEAIHSVTDAGHYGSKGSPAFLEAGAGR